MTQKLGISAAVVVGLFGPVVHAQDVALRPDQSQMTFAVNGQSFTVQRDQDTAAVLTGELARTSRPCPDFCIQPMIVAEGVTPVAELELLDFLAGPVAAGNGLLIDARLPDWFAKGTLPAAVNVPFAALAADNPYQTDILRALGASGDGGTLDFSAARALVVYANGPWDEQGTRAIKHLIAAGYPPSKIHNYRGGVQAWAHLGLTLTQPAP